MPMTYNLANKIANATLRNQSYTSPATVYAALYSTAPTLSTSGTELTGNGYARTSVTFSNPANGACSSNVATTFGPASGNNWPTVVAFSICDSSTGGNIMYYKGISGRNIKIGDSFTIDSGNLTIAIS
jgi:hypothetical protein